MKHAPSNTRNNVQLKCVLRFVSLISSNRCKWGKVFPGLWHTSEEIASRKFISKLWTLSDLRQKIWCIFPVFIQCKLNETDFFAFKSDVYALRWGCEKNTAFWIDAQTTIFLFTSCVFVHPFNYITQRPDGWQWDLFNMNVFFFQHSKRKFSFFFHHSQTSFYLIKKGVFIIKILWKLNANSAANMQQGLNWWVSVTHSNQMRYCRNCGELTFAANDLHIWLWIASPWSFHSLTSFPMC